MRIITDCLLFSALCFYAFLALGGHLFSPCYGSASRLGSELARFLPFHPLAVFWNVDEFNAKETAQGDSTEITNACAR